MIFTRNHCTGNEMFFKVCDEATGHTSLLSSLPKNPLSFSSLRGEVDQRARICLSPETLGSYGVVVSNNTIPTDFNGSSTSTTTPSSLSPSSGNGDSGSLIIEVSGGETNCVGCFWFLSRTVAVAAKDDGSTSSVRKTSGVLHWGGVPALLPTCQASPSTSDTTDTEDTTHESSHRSTATGGMLQGHKAQVAALSLSLFALGTAFTLVFLALRCLFAKKHRLARKKFRASTEASFEAYLRAGGGRFFASGGMPPRAGQQQPPEEENEMATLFDVNADEERSGGNDEENLAGSPPPLRHTAASSELLVPDDDDMALLPAAQPKQKTARGSGSDDEGTEEQGRFIF